MVTEIKEKRMGRRRELSKLMCFFGVIQDLNATQIQN